MKGADDLPDVPASAAAERPQLWRGLAEALAKAGAGRRMADTAAYLVDRVLPRAPVRHWVLSVPRLVRYILARDAGLQARARRIFVAEIFRDLRRRLGIRREAEGAGGAVTGIQRFGGSLNLNVHFHTIALDGVYRRDPESGDLRFQEAEPPTKDDLDRVMSRARWRIVRLLKRRGRLEEGSDAAGEESVLDRVRGASIQGRVGLDPGGRRVPVLGAGQGGWGPQDEKPYCVASGDGWSLQAGVRIRVGDREGLERLVKYVLRPALSLERLSRLPDGRIAVEFKKARPDGGTHLILEPVEFIEKLAALVSPPRAHLTCYDGVLAPRHRRRREVVGPSAEPAEAHRAGACGARAEGPERESDAGRPAEATVQGKAVLAGREEGGAAPGEGARRPNANVREDRGNRGGRGRSTEEPGLEPPKVLRTSARDKGGGRSVWSELMKRTMGLDVLACPRCGGRMSVLSCITDAELAARMLRSMGAEGAGEGEAAARRAG